MITLKYFFDLFLPYPGSPGKILTLETKDRTRIYCLIFFAFVFFVENKTTATKDKKHFTLSLGLHAINLS